MIYNTRDLGDYRLDPPDDDYDERLAQFIGDNQQRINSVLDNLETLRIAAELRCFDTFELKQAADSLSEIVREYVPGFERTDRVAASRPKKAMPQSRADELIAKGLEAERASVATEEEHNELAGRECITLSESAAAVFNDTACQCCGTKKGGEASIPMVRLTEAVEAVHDQAAENTQENCEYQRRQLAAAAIDIPRWRYVAGRTQSGG